MLCVTAVEQLRSSVQSLTARVVTLEKASSHSSSAPAAAQPAASNAAETADDDDEDDFELFGSDEEVTSVPFICL